MKKRYKALLLVCCMATFFCGCNAQKDVSDHKANDKSSEIEIMGETENRKALYIISEEDIPNIEEISYYNNDKKYVISDKTELQKIGSDVAKIQLGDEIPEDELLEGGIIVELSMKNGEKIEFGCAPNYIGLDKQYHVETDLYSEIIEKGFCEEE